MKLRPRSQLNQMQGGLALYRGSMKRKKRHSNHLSSWKIVGLITWNPKDFFFKCMNNILPFLLKYKTVIEQEKLTALCKMMSSLKPVVVKQSFTSHEKQKMKHNFYFYFYFMCVYSLKKLWIIPPYYINNKTCVSCFLKK